MIPNPQFLCSLNPTCSQFLKTQALEILIERNFHTALLPKLNSWDYKFIFESAKGRLMLMVTEAEQCWIYESTQTNVRVEVKRNI